MSGIFITGTGTEIGKTYLTERLLVNHCQTFTVSKPVMTDWPAEPTLYPQTDTGRLLQAQHLAVTPENIAACTPWRYAPPLTPWMAWAKSQPSQPLCFDALLQYCQTQINNASRQNKIHLIEGAGGIMSPLTAKETALDLIAHLNCSCVLVAGNYLGALSHTLTAVQTLSARGIKLAAVVVNQVSPPEAPQVDLAETVACLAAFLGVIPLFSMPYQATLTENLYLHLLSTLHIGENSGIK